MKINYFEIDFGKINLVLEKIATRTFVLGYYHMKALRV
jgi:hypothetical protein